MRYTIMFLAIAFCSAIACKKNKNDKYDPLNGNIRISGRVLLDMPKTAALSQPLPNVAVYINTGADTTIYIFQVTTDSTGKYTLPLLKKEYAYTLFTRFSSGNVPYIGAAHFTANGDAIVDVIVSPVYTNGMVLTLQDSLGGNEAKARMRLYTSKLAAIADYSADAVADTNANLNGQFAQYNVTPLKYFIVVKDSIKSFKFNVIDSITVADTGIATRTVILHS